MNLYIVSTPIGNLEDCSVRAMNTLRDAELIIAEDTRSTKKLLTLLGITNQKEFISYHAQSSSNALTKALEQCEKYERIALVTDAGTPTISDPGSIFVSNFRTQYPDSKVIPIPGISAVITALSVSGFPSSSFEFKGFIPHKKGRQTLFSSLVDIESTTVFYESPHRILKTLESLAEIIPDRPIMVGREMTKVFEEYPVLIAQEMFKYYTNNPEKVRGEFVLVIAPHSFDL